MRVLSVRQPWAWAIIHGGKDVENRTRNVAGDYRGPVAIHVALADGDAPDHLWSRHSAFYYDRAEAAGESIARQKFRPEAFDRGFIIGVVDLVDVYKDRSDPADALRLHGGGYLGQASRWAEPGAWHLRLENPRALPTPIPHKGMLGLQQLPPEVVEQITLGLA